MKLYISLLIYNEVVYGCYNTMIAGVATVDDVYNDILRQNVDPLKVLHAAINGYDYFSKPIDFDYDFSELKEYILLIDAEEALSYRMEGKHSMILDNILLIIDSCFNLSVDMLLVADYSILMIAQYLVDMYGIGAAFIMGSRFSNADWNEYYDDLIIFQRYHLYKYLKSLYKSKLIYLNKIIYGHTKNIDDKF